jgi:diguanylate cyclase
VSASETISRFYESRRLMPSAAAPWPLIWVALTAFAMALALLAVGANVAAVARAPGTPRSSALNQVANVLLAGGAWWPAYQALASQGHTQFAALTFTAATGWLMAVTARYGASRRWHDAKALSGAAATLLASLLCIALLQSLPGTGLVWSPPSLMALSLLLAVALRGMHAPLRSAPAAAVCRYGGAAVAAVSLTAVAYRTPAQAAFAIDPALLPTAALAALSAALAAVLRQARQQRAATAMASADTHTDALTGLPNRSALQAALDKASAVCDRDRSQLALMTINLDGFKSINATYGHAVGDQLLRQAASRIRRLVHERDRLARIGGDEFVLLLTERTAREMLLRLSEQITQNMARPYRLGSKEVTLSCSVGVALYPDHGAADMLLARSDAAMQAAKRSGGSRTNFYSATMETDLAENFELLRDFRQALDSDALTLVFQPKIDAASGQITAAEALLRWRDPQRGEVSPAVFVALAERFGLVARVGDWVIENACRQARTWADQGLNMRVAINLSAQHLRQPELAQHIREALARHKIDPMRLTCEITETLAMENTLATQTTLTQLGELGVHLSIDDFGTGYSSLSYLRKLPASEIKIDRSFVTDLERSADARAVVDAVIKLAHALGKRVVAEGVETLRQRRILTEMGCDELQGYLFAHPMAPADLLQWALDARNTDAQEFRSSLYVAANPQEQAAIAGARSERALH